MDTDSMHTQVAPPWPLKGAGAPLFGQNGVIWKGNKNGSPENFTIAKKFFLLLLKQLKYELDFPPQNFLAPAISWSSRSKKPNFDWGH